MKKASILWIDLEMTGLEPDKDKIIEVAAIATDWDLNEIAIYEEVVFQPQEVVDGMDEWAKQHHGASGLTARIADGKPIDQVEKELLEMIENHCGPEVYLAGNSVYHDRRFIRRAWPRLDSKLHYRILDISAWKIIMGNKLGVKFKKSEAHRALEDIRGSMEELKLYLRHFKR